MFGHTKTTWWPQPDGLASRQRTPTWLLQTCCPGSRCSLPQKHKNNIQSKANSLSPANLKPHIVLLNRTTGQHIEVESTLMQDVNIGALDVHYGNNVIVIGDSDLRLTVTIGDEEAILDGHLD